MPFAQGLRFLLELCALAALGFWGWQRGGSLGMSLVLGIGAPLLTAIVWGLFLAPKSPRAAPAAVRLLLELTLFALAAAGLVAVAYPYLAVALATAYAVDRFLLFTANRTAP